MKLIDPSVELIQQASGITGAYKQIEIAARNCYKSEDNITETSHQKMFAKLCKNGHLAMLEHGTVYLTLKWWNITKFFKYLFNPYSKVHKFKYVTTNFRVLLEQGWTDDLAYMPDIPTKYHEKRITLKFITNIGVTREANRHRTFPQPEEFSVAEESTRYCNYSNANKFGEDITFIKPVWISWGDLGEDDNCKELILKDAIGVYSVNKQAGTYLDSLIQSEEAYKELINLSWSPQQAREVLPLATKSEVVYTAFASDWKHWFDLRLLGTTGKPHPNMEQVAWLAQQELIKNNLWELIYDPNNKKE
jgi:thymidylate synthase (FAD)